MRELSRQPVCVFGDDNDGDSRRTEAAQGVPYARTGSLLGGSPVALAKSFLLWEVTIIEVGLHFHWVMPDASNLVFCYHCKLDVVIASQETFKIQEVFRILP